MKIVINLCMAFVLLILPVFGSAQNLFDGCESIAYDAIRDRYLATAWHNGLMAEIDSAGNKSVYMGGFSGSASNCILGDTVYMTTGTGLIAIDMSTETVFMDISLPVAGNADGVTVDTSGHVYVVDTQGRILKVDVATQNFSYFVTGLPNSTQDAVYDKKNDRLLTIAFQANAPIIAVNCSDSSTETVTTTPYGFYDGISMDDDGNVYLSYATAGQVVMYDSTFTNPPEIVTSGHNWPAGTDYNNIDDVLAIPYFEGDNVAFVSPYIGIEADTTYGFPPLEVNFTGSSKYTADSWSWDFGDGGTSDVQSPNYTYSDPGAYHVTLEVNSGGQSYSFKQKKYIHILNDTLYAQDIKGDPGESVEVIINGTNTIPTRLILIPVDYDGSLELTLDSFSIAGCRTEHFDYVSRISYDAGNRTAYFKVYNADVMTPILEPGSGPVMKAYFTISPYAQFGDTNPIILDGYSPTSIPRFYGWDFYFSPATVAGEVSLSGLCGDADGSGTVNILDISYLINYLYLGGPAPDPYAIGDVDGSGTINILDVSYLINYLYLDGPDPIC